MGLTSAQRSFLRKLRDDICRFAPQLQVWDKATHQMVPFRPWPQQEKLWGVLDEKNRVVVVKSRQVGITRAVRAWTFHRAMFAKEPETHILTSLRDESVKDIIRKVDMSFYDGLAEPLRRELAIRHAHGYVFGGTNAGVTGYPAGASGGTRSDVAATAHLTEFAYYQQQDSFLQAVDATVGAGTMVIETTVRGPGDAYHRLVRGALSGDNEWHVVFFPWMDFARYRVKTDRGLSDLNLTTEEEGLVHRHNLSAGQVLWRRDRVSTLGVEGFRREYPATVTEAFRAPSGTFFPGDKVAAIREVENEGEETILEDPQGGGVYAAGADVGAGVGKDASVLWVVNAVTGQPAYMYRTNKLNPKSFAREIDLRLARYEKPLLLVEENNHGGTTLNELGHLGYPHLWLQDGKPWYTSTTSKMTGYNDLRDRVDGEEILTLPVSTHLQISALRGDTPTPRAPDGEHDDEADALMLAYVCSEKAYRAHKRRQREARQRSPLERARVQRRVARRRKRF